MKDVIEERRKQETRAKKIMEDVDKTGKAFREEIKNLAEAEVHVQSAERKTIYTDKKLGSTEKRMGRTEKEIQEPHQRIRDTRTSSENVDKEKGQNSK